MGPAYKRGTKIVAQICVNEREDDWEIMIFDMKDSSFRHRFSCKGKLMPKEAEEKLDELLGAKQMTDNVNHPSYYTQGGIECIDAIKASMTPAEYEGYLKGNIIKYLWRWRSKGGVESLCKGRWYLNKLIESQEVSREELD